MRPELFRFFDVSFPAYFVFLLTGFMFATMVAASLAKSLGEDPDVMVDLGIGMLLSGIVGARLLHVLADGYFMDYVHLCTDPAKVAWKITKAECLSKNVLGQWDEAANVCRPSEGDCFAWAKFWAGGLTYYGGFMLAIPIAMRMLKRDRFPFGKAADCAGVAIAVGLVFGRMGCFLAGCCFGERTNSIVGFSFPPRSPASESHFKAGLLVSSREWSQHVHPTQLYESAGSLLVAFLCATYFWKRRAYSGQVFVAFMGLYAILRFSLEYLRDDDRGGVAMFSTSQWISLVALGAAIALEIWNRRKLQAVRSDIQKGNA